MSKEKRFEKIYSQSMGSVEIWVDKETGVNYVYRQSGYSGGLTVLLGKDGKPVLPLGKERLFRTNARDACCSSNELFKVFAPALRDESLINGLNRIIMLV